jgi:hypothetical protein
MGTERALLPAPSNPWRRLGKVCGPQPAASDRGKGHGRHLFPGYWLAGSLQFHVTRNVRAIVDEYLRTDATLQPGLKLKLLQAADILMRFTDMSQGR